MITITLTYRDRDLGIVEKCLDSLKFQNKNDFKVILVDFGSQFNFSNALKGLVKNYPFTKLIDCPVQGQLWNKSRAINIALRMCNTPYFFVGDIDMVFHPNFISTLYTLQNNHEIIYFQVGFLNREESISNKEFEEYEIKFKSTEEATGLTFYKTEILKSINGYDEFYHGWGSEDTDVHIRLKNAGNKINYYNDTILMLHQWHQKNYRSKNSSSPFHSYLERVNHKYMFLAKNNKVITANTNNTWGLLPKETHYLKLLEKPDIEIIIFPIDYSFSALLASFRNFNNQLVKVQINKVSTKDKLVQRTKKLLKKQYLNYLKLDTINNILLEELIKNYRNKPYSFNYNRENGIITLTIYFN